MAQPSREFILAEIRRCAEANGGKPLGRDRFGDETGIRDKDWIGKYWARWGDAVTEAGYAPNTLQGQRLDDTALLTALALLVRSLGHYPTDPELRLQRRQDAEFPSPNVVHTRLGSRAEQIRALADFTSGVDDFADVHALVAPLVAGAAKSEDSAPAMGYVYLLKSGKYYKIGRSNSVGRRERELSIQLPQKVERVHAIETDDPPGIEHYWHRRFREQRVRPDAEWFVLSADQVAAFKRRRTM